MSSQVSPSSVRTPIPSAANRSASVSGFIGSGAVDSRSIPVLRSPPLQRTKTPMVPILHHDRHTALPARRTARTNSAVSSARARQSAPTRLPFQHGEFRWCFADRSPSRKTRATWKMRCIPAASSFHREFGRGMEIHVPTTTLRIEKDEIWNGEDAAPFRGDLQRRRSPPRHSRFGRRTRGST